MRNIYKRSVTFRMKGHLTRLLAFIAFLAHQETTYAQKKVLQYLDGDHIKRKESLFLSMSIEGKDTVLNYYVGIDNYTDINRIQEHSKFLVSDGTAIYLEWINPLKFGLNVSSSRREDPIDESIAGFRDLLTGTLGSLAQDQEQADKLDNLFRAPAFTREGFRAEYLDQYITYEDLQLDTWYQLARIKIEDFVEEELFNNLAQELKDFETSASEDFKLRFKQINQNLSSINKASDIIGSLGSFGDAQGFLEDIGAQLEYLVERIDYFKNLNYGELFDSGVELSVYTKNSVFSFVQKIQLKIEQLKKSRDALNLIIGSLSKSVQNLTPGKNGKHYIRLIPSVVVERGQEVTMNIRLMTVATSDKSSVEAINNEIKFVRYRQFIPFVSSGVFYSSLQFNSFETSINDQNQTIVEEVSESQKPVYALLLNYTLNVRNSDVLPFLQLGVDPTKERPYLLFGAGFSFPQLGFALAGGMAWSWEKSLNGINVGDVVNGTADIKEMTQFDFNATPRVYLGIQIGL